MFNNDIMKAKAEQEALNNPWLPIVGAIGALGQTAVGVAGGLAKEKQLQVLLIQKSL